MRKIVIVLGVIVGVYLAARAVVEPFVIDFGDASSYRNDWGGPSLFGVLAVHCGPGIIAACLIGRNLRRRLHGASAKASTSM
ncbi:hypothetical protein [Streptomyces sp. SID14478]|uniref:hypothetical protein n=1 Tax=Streptomyces sp. SID14478 TaxID=2706073 RepID=UPI0019455B76|nr:hypothetical protein [Streptomyces sp. SID14478]